MRTLLLVSLAVTTAVISTVSLAAGNESSQAAKGPPVIKSAQLQKTADAEPIPPSKRAEFAPPRQVDTKPASSGPGLPSSRQIEVTEQQPGPGPAPIFVPPPLNVEQAPAKVQVQAAPPPALKLVEAPAPQQVQVAPAPVEVEQVQVEATPAPQVAAPAAAPAPVEAQGTGTTEAAPPTEVQLAPVAPEAKPVKKAKRKVIVRYYEDDYGYNDGYGYGSGYASSDDYGYGGSTNAGYSSSYGSSSYGGGYDDGCN
jgi:hypothetical protein